jgi:hypothetical protein
MSKGLVNAREAKRILRDLSKETGCSAKISDAYICHLADAVRAHICDDAVYAQKTGAQFLATFRPPEPTLWQRLKAWLSKLVQGGEITEDLP